VKWGVQNVKVTLENESGETVVIEQSADGRVKCEPGKGSKGERAANSAPAAKNAKVKEERKPASEPPKAKEAAKARTAKKDEAPKARASAAPDEGKSKSRRRAPLKWSPVKDHGYDGFAAPSGGGKFKVLIAKDSQWALFFELKNTWPKHIGCFGRKVDKAKARAQELHDAGWPESEFGPITAGQVARACPATQGDEDEDEESTEMKTEEKTTTPAQASESKSDAARDKDLMGSFTSELDAMLDEDEDD
jgi:hypothetical protein